VNGRARAGAATRAFGGAGEAVQRVLPRGPLPRGPPPAWTQKPTPSPIPPAAEPAARSRPAPVASTASGRGATQQAASLLPRAAPPPPRPRRHGLPPRQAPPLRPHARHGGRAVAHAAGAAHRRHLAFRCAARPHAAAAAAQPQRGAPAAAAALRAAPLQLHGAARAGPRAPPAARRAGSGAARGAPIRSPLNPLPLSTPSPSQPPPPHVPSRARPAHPPHYPPGLVVHGREWFFGYGISSAPAGATPFGAPDRVVNLGATEVPGDMVEELVADLAPRFRPEDYNVRGRVGAGFGRGGAGVKARP
jgi:hypothetical protein